MNQEAKLATVENVVTAICFGVGILLVVLALYTLMAVKSVHAENQVGFGIGTTSETMDSAEIRTDAPGTFTTEMSEVSDGARR